MRLPRAERTAQVLRAAAGAFLERGYEATSMEDVARAAGVSRLIVYRIFENKAALYRDILDDVWWALGERFDGVSLEDLRERGAAWLLLPVARSRPDAFRLLWRSASEEPDFADQAVAFAERVYYYAGEMLSPNVHDPLVMAWAKRAAGGHLVDGICLWLDHGDPARDDEFADLLTAGLRALSRSWGQTTTPRRRFPADPPPVARAGERGRAGS